MVLKLITFILSEQQTDCRRRRNQQRVYDRTAANPAPAAAVEKINERGITKFIGKVKQANPPGLIDRVVLESSRMSNTRNWTVKLCVSRCFVCLKNLASCTCSIWQITHFSIVRCEFNYFHFYSGWQARILDSLIMVWQCLPTFISMANS